MQSRISIKHWQDLDSFDGVAVVFDIFRCSSTIHCLWHKKVKELWIAPSLENLAFTKEFKIFSELPKTVECKERFDNSPALALENAGPSDTALVATTTGTPAMFAASKFTKVYIGSLLNFSTLVLHLSKGEEPITLIPAAFKDSNHVEDQITAQAMATALDGFWNFPEFVTGCGMQALSQIKQSGRAQYLGQKLETGKDDTQIAQDLDRYNFILGVSYDPDKINLAQVVSI